MVSDIAEALKSIGLSLSLGRCEWFSSDDDVIWSEVNFDGTSVPQTLEIILLRTQITNTVDNTKEVMSII